MVTKKKKKKDAAPISEIDRMRVQVVNAVVDRTNTQLENAQIRMENAQLGIALAQRDLDLSKSELQALGQELSNKYDFDMNTDSVDWTTGKILRCKEDTGANDG